MHIKRRWAARVVKKALAGERQLQVKRKSGSFARDVLGRSCPAVQQGAEAGLPVQQGSIFVCQDSHHGGHGGGCQHYQQ